MSVNSHIPTDSLKSSLVVLGVKSANLIKCHVIGVIDHNQIVETVVASIRGCLKAPTPSCKQPSPHSAIMWWSMIVWSLVLALCASKFGCSSIPTAFPIPAPKGPCGGLYAWGGVLGRGNSG